MKRKFIYSTFAVSAAVAVLIGVQGFAEEQPVLISEKVDSSENIIDEKKEELNYSILKGTIKEITKSEDGNIRIEYTSDKMGDVILNEAEGGCMIIDDTSVSNFSALKKGMEATVVMDNKAPMALSYPGQTSGAVAIVVNSDKFAVVEKFDENLTGSTIIINVGDETPVLDVRGTEQLILADGIRGHECLVLYGASTKSIPAQTTPDLVVVLDNADEDKETEESKSIELREVLENMGYTVEWTASDKPIKISNGEISATVEIGSKAVDFGTETIVLPSDITIVDGVTYAPSEIANYF